MKDVDGQTIKEFLNPSPRLKIFIVKDFKDKRLGVIAEQLYQRPLWIPDEGRNYDAIWQLIYASLLNPLNLFYEIKDMKGIVGFMNVYQKHKGEFFLMLWNGKYSHKLHKDIDNLIQKIAKAFKLKRLFTQTPDEKMAKLYEKLGFKIEGRQKYGFKWGEKYYTNILLRRIF